MSSGCRPNAYPSHGGFVRDLATAVMIETNHESI
jgi:hypothetical protein